ncbi:hypothetical protein [Granulicella tundricola]|uniref:Uncharacterized protein n=1 Tax=Granulicella tundricola (strain ATCC BAA-1859 / DSM 23138 / MP5ACTX9) TaxID=1198114 RepID=E8WYT2_GRATM|nr:hypothetical protein [Granulicella tundricola]ADW68768.1 hypothetical protein AciX9_1720 [Granulicella tundricola MP5ACTX9]
MYAVFVIAAILLSASPMHAHTLIAAILPSSTPAQHLAASELTEPRDLAPATRPAPRKVPVPPVFPDRSNASIPAASPAPAVPLSAAALLTHAPNAP